MAGSKLTKAQAGALGARTRWGPPRIVRLDDLTADQRRVILALIDAARAGQRETASAVSETSAEAVTGGRRFAVDNPRAA
jgi:hypothetical protein